MTSCSENSTKAGPSPRVKLVESCAGALEDLSDGNITLIHLAPSNQHHASDLFPRRAHGARGGGMLLNAPGQTETGGDGTKRHDVVTLTLLGDANSNQPNSRPLKGKNDENLLNAAIRMITRAS